ncbi:TIGR03943 family protein [Corynebacterium sp. 13CS0277]|uniref:TIGR03943 family putative permease subunit n=1 Tax=Corynebacterium sp. 13CS0277 TaxID=2071994 RepID=UPI000D027534|nr:TIGR03943 family protein [Corynebacterium sp. 13CS0277]PRQ10450.1 TIGR03943 family protein [Corynebacterium sp. 13CS0277]
MNDRGDGVHAQHHHGDHTHEEMHAEAHTPSAWTLLAWLALSSCCIGLVASGRVGTYLRPLWHPVLLIVAVVVAAATGWICWEQRHRLRLRGDRVGPLVLIPACVVALCAPQALGGGMLQATTQAADTPRSAAGTGSHRQPRFAPLAAGEVHPLTLENLSDRYLFGDAGALDGVEVDVEGFIAHHTSTGQAAPPGEAYLYRFKIYCCAADAISYGAILRSADAAHLPEEQWVRVRGTVRTRTPHTDPGAAQGAAAGAGTPAMVVIEPHSITPIEAPDDPYL